MERGHALETNGFLRDLLAMRRHLWLPLTALVVALLVASGLQARAGGSSEASFHLRVVYSALPPLFGPPMTPSNVDAARFATSPEVLARVSDALNETNLNRTSQRLAGEVKAVPVSTNRVDFTVKEPDGDAALAIAKAWRAQFEAVAKEEASSLQRQVSIDYKTQLAMAQQLMLEKETNAKAAPDDISAQNDLKAAQDNYQTAARLSQSYEVVARTVRADVFEVKAPALEGGTFGDWASRLGAGAAFGLVVGVLGALGLEAISRIRGASSRVQLDQ